MNKGVIKARFTKTLSTYDENARIQKKMAERLVSLLDIISCANILEIGCGTGFLTELLTKKLQFKTYTSLDIVKDCETYIKNINSQINFINADIEDFISTDKETYDLIISNASLQWVDNFEEVINNLRQKLTQNGTLLISTFGRENFREIGLITGTTLDYYSPQELEAMFTSCEVYPEIHIMAFNTPKDVLKHLQLTGVNAIESKSWTKKDLTKFENAYNSICPNRPTLTYNPIYIKLEPARSFTIEDDPCLRA